MGKGREKRKRRAKKVVKAAQKKTMVKAPVKKANKPTDPKGYEPASE
jgi:hypothetical protein